MDMSTVFGQVATDSLSNIEAAITLGIPVLVALVAIGIFLLVFRKFGIRR